MFADRVGVDYWDIDHNRVRAYIKNEMEPSSRFWFGSPCRFVRTLDLLVHVYVPSAIEAKYPELATYLRSTSPRWGRRWREW
jgi:hypothetical protein